MEGILEKPSVSTIVYKSFNISLHTYLITIDTF